MGRKDARIATGRCAWVITALLAAMSLAISAASCSRAAAAKSAETRPGFAVPRSAQLDLAVDAGGALSVMAARATDGVAEGAASPIGAGPEPFPIAVTVASIQPLGDGAVLAINRIGLYALSVVRYAEDADVRLVIDEIPGANGEFAGRTVAPSWRRGDEAMFLLFRHPIYELSPPRTPASVLIAATIAGAKVVDAWIGGDAFALFPVSADSWLVQYRYDDGDKINTSYSRMASSTGATESLERAAFEKAASPQPIASAPESLREAAKTLTGPLLVEARLADGSRRAYVRGDPGEAAPAWGQVLSPSPSGIAAIIVTDDWRAVIARAAGSGYAATETRLTAPVPDAQARDAAVVGGLLAVAWEEDLFPDVGASGIVVLDPGL